MNDTAVTADALVRKLRSVGYHRFLKRSDGIKNKRGQSRMLTPGAAVTHFDRCFQLGICASPSDEENACALFDLAHLPLEMVLLRRQRKAELDEAALADSIYQEILTDLDD